MDLVLKKVTNWWQAKIDGKLDSPVFKTKTELLDHYMVHHIVEEESANADLSIDPDDETFTKILKVAIKNNCYLFGGLPINVEVVEPFIYKLYFKKKSRLVSVNDLLTVQAGLIEFLIEKDWLNTMSYAVNDSLDFARWIIDMASPYSWSLLLFVKLYETEDRLSIIHRSYTWPLKF